MVLDVSSPIRAANEAPHQLLIHVFKELVEFTRSLVPENTPEETRYNQIISRIKPQISNKAIPKAVISKKKPPAPKCKASKPAVNTDYYPFSLRLTIEEVEPFENSDQQATPPELQIAMPQTTQELSNDAFLATRPAFNHIYEASAIADYQHFFDSATNLTNFNRWFYKTNSVETAQVQRNAVKRFRPSVVPSTYSQRLGILVHALRKSIDSKATFQDVKNAVVNLSFTKEEYYLLSETVVDVKAFPDLMRSISDIKDLIDNDETLHVDEEFLYFICQIPNIKERMRCVYVSHSFEYLSSMIVDRLDTLYDSISMIFSNRKLNLVFQTMAALTGIVSGKTNTRAHGIRLHGLRRITDIKGVNGMTLADYLAAYMPQTFSESERKLLATASGYGALSTYSAARDLIRTFLSMNNVDCENRRLSEPGMDSENSPPSSNDKFTVDVGLANRCYIALISKYIEKLRPAFTELVVAYGRFWKAYCRLAYYMGDQKSFLPIDTKSNELELDDDGSNDLLALIHGLSATLIAIPTNVKLTIGARIEKEADAIDHVDPITSRKSMSVTSITNPGNESDTGTIPIFRRPLLIRHRFGIRAGVKRRIPGLAPDSNTKRSSVDHSYELARNL